jgi:hypothetical protein
MKLRQTLASLAFGAMLVAPVAYSCPPPLIPDTADLSQYKTIFIGVVSTVRQMPQTEWRTLCINGRRHATLCRSKEAGQQVRPMYEISVLPRTSILNAPLGVVTLQLPGCGEQIPRMQGYGIFFLPNDAREPVVPIYDSESLLYSNLLLKLGALKPDSSNWDKIKNENSTAADY